MTVGFSAAQCSVAPLRSLLLTWWEQCGRHSIPWKLSPGGEPPAAGELLDPYKTWVAEAKRR